MGIYKIQNESQRENKRTNDLHRAFMTCGITVYCMWNWSPRRRGTEQKKKNMWRNDGEKFPKFHEHYKPTSSRISMNPNQDKKK